MTSFTLEMQLEKSMISFGAILLIGKIMYNQIVESQTCLHRII
jgi:hypothetical protein